MKQHYYRNTPKTASGRVGVYWKEGRQKWHATFRANRKTKHLGYFTNKADAIAAREAAEVEALRLAEVADAEDLGCFDDVLIDV